MVKTLINSCFPIYHKRQASVTLVFFENGSTKTLSDSKKHVAGEIMFEFPDQIVCHADSFFIGRQVPALAMDDYLIHGQTYFVLPIERFAYRILTTSCLSIFNSSLDNENVRSNNSPTLSFTAPLSPPPFEYSKGVNGKILIKISPDFIISLIRKNIKEDAITDCGVRSHELCNSPELKKQYDQLVGTREHLWSPRLQTISEYKIRVSPLRFLGIIRRQEEVNI